MRWKYKRWIVAILVICLMIPQFFMTIEEKVHAASEGKCTASTLYIRKGPSTSNENVLVNGAKAYLVKDQTVTIIGEKDGWYQIEAVFQGTKVEGYSLGTYITVTKEQTVTPTSTPTPTSAPAQTTPSTNEVAQTDTLNLPASVSASTLNVRKVASATATKLGTITKGTTVTVLEETYKGDDKWYKITVKINSKTTTGYVLSNYITLNLTTGFYAKVNEDSTLLRESAGANKAAKKTSTGSIVSLKQDNLVWVSKETTVSGVKYFLVGLNYNGEVMRGYVASTQIKLLGKKPTITQTPVKDSVNEETVVTPTPTTTETTQNESMSSNTPTTSKRVAVLKLDASVSVNGLNLRKSAGTTGEKIAALAKGTKVVVIGAKINGTEKWYQVTTAISGKTVTGYVLSDYVAMTLTTGFYAKTNRSNVVLRVAAGTNQGAVKLASGDTVALTRSKTVWVSKEATVGGVKYFYVGLKVDGKAVRGYVPASQLYLVGTYVTVAVTPTVTPVPTSTPTPSPTSTPAPSPTTTPAITETPSTGEEDYQIPASITAWELNIRKDASTTSEKIGTLTNGNAVVIIHEEDVASDTWYQVKSSLNGSEVTGYVFSNFVKLTLNDSVTALADGEVTLKTIPSKTSLDVKRSNGSSAILASGTKVTIQSEQTNDGSKWFYAWALVGTETIKGYVLASEVNLVTKSTSDNTTSPTPSPTKTPEVTQVPTPTPIVEPTVVPTVIPTPTAVPTPTATEVPTPTPTAVPTPTPSTEAMNSVGTIKDASALAVKESAGYSSSVIKDQNGYAIVVAAGLEVTVTEKTYVDRVTWYKITFMKSGTSYSGYVNQKYVTLTSDSTGTLTPTPTPFPETSVDFETKLANQNFPESYKVLLRKLHAIYPKWEFEAYQTGLDWNTVINNQSVVAKNLITNTKSIEWKSLDAGAYNWKTDSFIAYDGSTWVTASKEAIGYYMDPRNFLDEKSIFQFEVLTYKQAYQNLAGVEDILKYTPFYNASYTYTDETGVERLITYAETFIKAAEYANVSPYHLASRAKQEVVTGTTTLSSSVSGMVAGFEGLYNFYNIGAYHSTVPGGAIANGLKYARSGSTNVTLNMSSLIPWSNRYRSIVGGAFIIGNSYISRGQDTIYLQKFNVTPISTYYHQYMANVEAAYAEGKKVYAAYSNISNLPIVFSIPVYLNMPLNAVTQPVTAYNPNNYLASLAISDIVGNELLVTPTFKTGESDIYYLVVDNSIDLVNVTATTVSSKARLTGQGVVALVVGNNVIELQVTAQNGDVRTYTINIIREDILNN